MNLWGATAAGLFIAAGVVLVRWWRDRRPDPIRRAVAGHPVAFTAPGLHIVHLWDEHFGAARRDADRDLLGAAAISTRTRVAVLGLAVAGGALFGAAGGGVPGALLWSAGAAGGALAVCDRTQAGRADRLRAQLDDQTLGFAELVALAATAGMPTAAAIEEAGAHTPPPLRQHIDRIVTDIRTGTPVVQALAAAGDRLRTPAFSRLVDAVTTATTRGTPVAGTLLAQVADERSRRHADRLERAGRADVAMLVPVVFVVLPAVVVVAVYPGLLALGSL